MVTGDVSLRRPSPRSGHGADSEELGTAPVRPVRSNHAAAQSRLAAHGARRCEQQAGCVGTPGSATVENVRRSRLERRCPRLRGGSAGGSHWIAKCNAKGKEHVTVSDGLESAKHNCTQKQGCSNRESRESRGAKKRRFGPNREALNKIPNRQIC